MGVLVIHTALVLACFKVSTNQRALFESGNYILGALGILASPTLNMTSKSQISTITYQLAVKLTIFELTGFQLKLSVAGWLNSVAGLIADQLADLMTTLITKKGARR